MRTCTGDRFRLARSTRMAVMINGSEESMIFMFGPIQLMRNRNTMMMLRQANPAKVSARFGVF